MAHRLAPFRPAPGIRAMDRERTGPSPARCAGPALGASHAECPSCALGAGRARRPARLHPHGTQRSPGGRAAVGRSGKRALENLHAARFRVELHAHQMDRFPEVAVLGRVAPLPELRERRDATARIPHLELEQVHMAAGMDGHVQPSAVAAVLHRHFDVQPGNVAVENTRIVPLIARDLIARVPFVRNALVQGSNALLQSGQVAAQQRDPRVRRGAALAGRRGRSDG